MFCEEILTKEVPTLTKNTKGSQALGIMGDSKLKHLPVIQDDKYLYLLSEKDLFDMNNPENEIGNISYYAPHINTKTPVFEILHIMSEDKLSFLPVIDDNGKYVGGVTLPALIEKLDEICNAGYHGASIGIEVNGQDYVLSQLVHLVESNNAHIQSLLSFPIKETGKQILLLKVDLEDASPILRSLERFDYRVRFCIQEQGLTDETIKKRLDELMYYIEM
ncbi:CBS domain-containing protein [Bacteroidales bacterium OttesenSCG-928-A17]|nr:CBS domain-containing protein [Bacteroidales bacterium OttesenSCG-928-A17]